MPILFPKGLKVEPVLRANLSREVECVEVAVDAQVEDVTVDAEVEDVSVEADEC